MCRMYSQRLIHSDYSTKVNKNISAHEVCTMLYVCAAEASLGTEWEGKCGLPEKAFDLG